MPQPRESQQDHDRPDAGAGGSPDDVLEADPAADPAREQDEWVDDQPQRQAGG